MLGKPAGSINGVTVYGSLQRDRGELRSFRGRLTTGDNDAPRLVQLMGDDTPLIYTGTAIEDGKTRPIRLPVLISITMGTAATVVEVTSAGAPLEED